MIPTIAATLLRRRIEPLPSWRHVGRGWITLAWAVALLAGCGGSSHPSLPAVDVKIPTSFLTDELLLGVDYQNYEQNGAAYRYPEALPHEIARFSQVGSRLLLYRDAGPHSASDAPSASLVAAFTVLQKSQRQLKVALEEVSICNNEGFARRISFDETHGNVLLLEISCTSADGNSVEHLLVSLFPSRNLEPAALDADGLFSAQQAALVGRIGVFWAESYLNYDETPLKEAVQLPVRYDISGGRTIDWYVTGNVPAELLPTIRAGVEGWNRYFADFRSDAVVVFRGVLPEGVPLGHPAYNVVVFDPQLEVGAAWASMAYHPVTGLISHSLIYMPYMWYQAGQDNLALLTPPFTNEAATAAAAPAAPPHTVVMANTSLLQRCHDAPKLRAAQHSIANAYKMTLDEAGRALLRSVLLHEVGHALGARHNFKASVSATPQGFASDAGAFASSIMDYNDYGLEIHAFTDESNPSLGPVLPYDHQFVDFLYNNAAQITAHPEQFPPLPYCTDEDADGRGDNAVYDPFCLTYDMFATPLQSLAIATGRLDSTTATLAANLGGFTTAKGFVDAAWSTLEPEFVALTHEAAQNGAAVAEALVGAWADASGALYQQLLSSTPLGFFPVLRVYSGLLGEWDVLPTTLQGGDVEFALSGWGNIDGLAATGARLNSSALAQFKQDVRAALVDSVTLAFPDPGDLTPGTLAKLQQLLQTQLTAAVALARPFVEDAKATLLARNQAALLAAAMALSDAQGRFGLALQLFLGETPKAVAVSLAGAVYPMAVQDIALPNFAGHEPDAVYDTALHRQLLAALYSQYAAVALLSKAAQASRDLLSGLMPTQVGDWQANVQDSLMDQLDQLENTLQTTQLLSEAEQLKYDFLLAMVGMLY